MQVAQSLRYVDIRNHLPVVVIDMLRRSLRRRSRCTTSERVVSINFCEHSIGRDRDKLVLAVPLKVERRLSVAARIGLER